MEKLEKLNKRANKTKNEKETFIPGEHIKGTNRLLMNLTMLLILYNNNNIKTTISLVFAQS